MKTITKITTRLRTPLLALAICAMFAACAFACPTCKDGLAQTDPQHASIARGYFYSILFMMSMPFAILGTFGSMAYISIRRARAQQAGEGAGDGVQGAGGSTESHSHS